MIKIFITCIIFCVLCGCRNASEITVYNIRDVTVDNFRSAISPQLIKSYFKVLPHHGYQYEFLEENLSNKSYDIRVLVFIGSYSDLHSTMMVSQTNNLLELQFKTKLSAIEHVNYSVDLYDILIKQYGIDNVTMLYKGEE